MPPALPTLTEEAGNSPSAVSNAKQPEHTGPAQGTAHVERIAAAIKQAGLSAPALLLLGALKPLSWVGGQMLWVLQPFLGSPRKSTVAGSLTLSGVARFLEGEGNVDELVRRLSDPTGIKRNVE